MSVITLTTIRYAPNENSQPRNTNTLNSDNVADDHTTSHLHSKEFVNGFLYICQCRGGASMFTVLNRLIPWNTKAYFHAVVICHTLGNSTTDQIMHVSHLRSTHYPLQTLLASLLRFMLTICLCRHNQRNRMWWWLEERRNHITFQVLTLATLVMLICLHADIPRRALHHISQFCVTFIVPMLCDATCNCASWKMKYNQYSQLPTFSWPLHLRIWTTFSSVIVFMILYLVVYLNILPKM